MHGGYPSKSTLALQIEHNRSARGPAGMIFTRDDRAGAGKLSSRLGLVTDAIEAKDGFDFYAYLVAHLSQARTIGGAMVVEGAQVVVGDVDHLPDEIGYEVLCRRHHIRRLTSAGARAGALSPDVLPVDPVAAATGSTAVNGASVRS